MPEISRFFGIIIRMYWADHNPPHFHAYYQEFEAEYNIHTLELLRGDLPRTAHRLVMEWASAHHEELLEDWQLCTEEEPLRKIEPLT